MSPGWQQILIMAGIVFFAFILFAAIGKTGKRNIQKLNRREKRRLTDKS